MNKFKINNFTYFFFLSCFFCGFIKNAIILFLIIIIHELGHIIVIKLSGYEIDSVTIYPFGGITRINKLINSSLFLDFIIAISGVLFQYLVVTIFLNILTINDNTRLLITTYNKTLFIFNLLPIIPLDGSKIIQNVLEHFFSYKKSYFITLITSVISIILFINYNIFYSLNNYLIIFVLIYNTLKYFKDFKYTFNKFLLERILYHLKYKRIVNNTKNISDLCKNKYHYFKSNKKYISENQKIAKIFDKNTYF